jgi:hypothetical protein
MEPLSNPQAEFTTITHEIGDCSAHRLPDLVCQRHSPLGAGSAIRSGGALALGHQEPKLFGAAVPSRENMIAITKLHCTRRFEITCKSNDTHIVPESERPRERDEADTTVQTSRLNNAMFLPGSKQN